MKNHGIFKPELLAPAGREDVLHAVLEAGADAVYLSGKSFNMRRHRKDFHFSEEALERGCRFAHDFGKKLYVTVNSLVGPDEIAQLEDYLHYLESIRVDAIIVQDPAVIRVCNEKKIQLDLHASTMMNVNSVHYAAFLKKHGVSRVVTSRDITIEDARRIKEQAKIEVEYFVHGDMCSVQSGQCLSSGVTFGKSSNRGQCMKPCRWAYDLISETSGRAVASEAFLLASGDMCLLQQLPEVMKAGVDSLKIEGRMRPAETLRPIVRMYCDAIDRLVENPLGGSKIFQETSELHAARTRNLTTGFAFKTPDTRFMQLSGEREPLFLSRSGTVPVQEKISRHAFQLKTPIGAERHPEMTVIAGDSDVAKASLEAGIDNLILSWEGNLTVESTWQPEEIRELISLCKLHDARLVMNTAKILTERELNELQCFAEMYDEITHYCITGPAAIELLKPRDRVLWGDATLNVINPEACRFFGENGVERLTPATESSFADVECMIRQNPELKFDVPVHGPITGMIVEHCLVAMNMPRISKSDFCRMPCAADSFAMKDKAGNVREIKTDRYCRNHIILEHHLATLLVLSDFMKLGASGFKIDARLYTAETVRKLVELYSGNTDSAELKTAFPESTFTYGAYPLGVFHDASISRLKIKKEEKYEQNR